MVETLECGRRCPGAGRSLGWLNVKGSPLILSVEFARAVPASLQGMGA